MRHQWWKRPLAYVMLYAILVFLYIYYDKMEWNANTDIVQFHMILAVGLSIFGFLAWKIFSKKELDKYDGILVAMVCMGFILRIGYCLYTPWFLRQHDIATPSLDSNGHAAYIVYLFNGKLPDTNDYQFYHPPFYHICSAITLHIIGFFKGESKAENLIEGSKMVSCFATCVTLIQVKHLFKEIGLKKYALCIAFGIVALFPYFFIASGTINNDALSILFMVIAFRYTLKWYESKSWKDIVVTALAYGFGMMTKSSCATMALFTAGVMIYVFVKVCKGGTWLLYVKQYLLFGGIALPLGMWYAIRNLVKFNQPINYVLELPVENPVWCGDHTIAERFLPDLSLIFNEPIFCNPCDDYNIYAYSLKTAMMGEYTFVISTHIVSALLLFGGLLAVMSLLAMIYVIIRKTKDFKWISLVSVWVIQMVSFVIFNVQYPFACTMDYRYIPFTSLVGAASLGMTVQLMKQRTDSKPTGRLKKVMELCVIGISILFAIFSISFYFISKTEA